MNAEENMKKTDRKEANSYRIAGITCFPVAAVFVVYLVFGLIFTVHMWKASIDAEGETQYFIVYFIAYFIGRFAVFGGIVFTLVNIAIGGMFILSGVRLIKDASNFTNLSGIKTYLKLSFSLSIVILIFSALPFILGFCRTVLRPEQEWRGFLLYGLMPFVTAAVCFVFNRIAVYRFKKSNLIF